MRRDGHFTSTDNGTYSRISERASAVSQPGLWDDTAMVVSFDCSAILHRLRRAIPTARWLLLAIVISGLHFAPAMAQDQNPSVDVIDLNPEDLKTVRVYTASMYLQSDREAPSSVTIVTADQIRKFGYRTMAEILKSVRGFYVGYDRNYSYAGLRGFSRPGDYNDRFLLLIDGHRMNDNVYGQAFIGTEFPLDVDLIERVEIVRGPSSSLYGTNAFYAVVNVITKPADTVGGVELSADAGGSGTYRGRATYGLTERGMEILVSGSIYESAGASQLYFPAFDSPLTNYGIAQNADGDSSKNLFASLKFGQFTLESVVSTRTKNIPTASFGTVFNDSRTRTRDTAGFLDLQYNRTLKDATNVTLRVSYDTDAYRGTYADSPVVPQGAAVLNQDLERGDWLTINANATRTSWQKHKLDVGATLQDDLRQNQTNYDVSPYFLYLHDQRRSLEWGIFVQDEFRVAKNLIIYAGIRHDQYETFGGTTNPRLALIYAPRKSTVLKLIYGQAFRAPSNYELYFQDGHSTEANPNLRPERIKSTEFVWEQSLGANSRLSASAFYNGITSLIGQQSDVANQLLIFQNSQNVRSKGLEFELAGKIHDEIECRVSYSLQGSEDSATGIVITNSPAQLAKANLIWPLPRVRMSIGAEALYTDRRKTWAGTFASRYAVANLTATSSEFAGGFRLSASVYNLFNSKYSDPAGSEIAEPTLVQNGRDFRIQMTRVFHFH
jgi:outer membrane receptor for ferrienterochelin and colicins